MTTAPETPRDRTGNQLSWGSSPQFKCRRKLFFKVIRNFAVHYSLLCIAKRTFWIANCDAIPLISSLALEWRSIAKNITRAAAHVHASRWMVMSRWLSMVSRRHGVIGCFRETRSPSLRLMPCRLHVRW